MKTVLKLKMKNENFVLQRNGRLVLVVSAYMGCLHAVN